MSEDDPNNHAELVPVEHGLALPSPPDNRIVSEMVADWLVLARDFAAAPVDLDALVRDAKRLLFHSKGHGMTDENIRAFKLFFRAAEAGHSEAQFCFGCLLSFLAKAFLKIMLKRSSGIAKLLNKGMLCPI